MTTVIIDFKEKKVLADRQTTQTYYEETSVLNMVTGTEPKVNKDSFGIESNDKMHKVGDVVIVGSGGDYAYGAIKAGVSSEEAIVAASRCDKYTSFEYDVVTL